MTAKKAQAAKVEAPQGTLSQDEDADNPGERVEQEDEATRLMQERIDAGQVGTLAADQEAAK